MDGPDSTMKKMTKSFVVLAGLFTLFANPLLVQARAQEVVALVGRDITLTALSIDDLREIYQGNRKVWRSGESIELFLPPEGSPAMSLLVKQVFRKHSSTDLSKFYLRAIFKNKFSRPPKSYQRALEAVALIHRAPGGIAIISAHEIVNAPLVRVVPIHPEAP